VASDDRGVDPAYNIKLARKLVEAARRKSSMIACLWCEHSFERRSGGSPQRFCGPRCRNAFWSALRQWGDRAITDGVLTIANLKNGTAAACTLLQRGNPTRALHDIEPNPVADPHAPLRFIVEVERSIVDGLVKIGFIRLDERDELLPIINAMKRLGRVPDIWPLA
jgi:hypothetical protein